MANIDDEINKLRVARFEEDQTKAKFLSAGAFDSDIYQTDKYDGFLNSVLDEEDIIEDEYDSLKNRRLVSSFGPAKMQIPDDPDDVEEPTFEEKKKSNKPAEREDEYRARWRQRPLSPPQHDPFATKEKAASHVSTYKERMLQQELDKERDEIFREINKRKREKQDESEKNKKARWIREGEDRKRGWTLFCHKQGSVCGDPLPLLKNHEYRAGRQPGMEVLLEHPTCSKQHAKICMLRIKTSEGKKKFRPHVVDNGSTNGTFINQQKIPVKKPIEVTENDVLTFGTSAREYRCKHFKT